jgi:hypothetical protein
MIVMMIAITPSLNASSRSFSKLSVRTRYCRSAPSQPFRLG